MVICLTATVQGGIDLDPFVECIRPAVLHAVSFFSPNSKVRVWVMFLYLPELFHDWCCKTLLHDAQVQLQILSKQERIRQVQPLQDCLFRLLQASKRITSDNLKKNMLTSFSTQTYHTGGCTKAFNMYHQLHCKVFIWVVQYVKWYSKGYITFHQYKFTFYTKVWHN